MPNWDQRWATNNILLDFDVDPLNLRNLHEFM